MTAPHAEPGPAGRVLGLFAKHPQAGSVKTRLAALVSPEWARTVADAFLADLLERLAGFPARRVLAYSPPEARPAFAELAGGRFELVPQHEGDLGARLAAFLAGQLQAGARQVVVLGTDSPTVPLAYVEQAFRELDHAGVVLGPATDGGYYLVGCAGRVPPIFDGVPWSGPRVLEATVAGLRDPEWRLGLLPPWYDVDTPADWWMLRGHLAALRRAGLDPGVPRTERLALGSEDCLRHSG